MIALALSALVAQAPITFDDGAGIDRYGWSTPRLDGSRIEGVEFYEAIDRLDLAAAYRRRNSLRWGVFGGGLVAFLGGVRLASSARLEQIGDSRLDFIPMERGRGKVTQLVWSDQFVWGLALVGVGYLGMLTPVFMNPHPVSPFEAKRLAEAHNRRRTLRLAVSPGGVVLAGDF